MRRPSTEEILAADSLLTAMRAVADIPTASRVESELEDALLTLLSELFRSRDAGIWALDLVVDCAVTVTEAVADMFDGEF